MRVHARVWVLSLICGVLAAVALPAAAQAFGIEKFAAVNCKQASPECASTGAPFFFPEEPGLAKAKAEGFTEAGGRVPYGVTTFKVASEGAPGEEYPAGFWPVGVGKLPFDPTKLVDHIRTDVAPGLATNPFAPARCTSAEFGAEAAKGVFLEPKCPAGSVIGVNHVVVYIPELNKDVPLEGTVYDLAPGEGWASKFGVAIPLELLGHPGLFAHTIINGNVEWGKQPRGTDLGDYHDYFEIEVSPELPLLSSRLVFKGNINEKGEVGAGDFITNPTTCKNEANLITAITLTDVGGEPKTKSYVPPKGIELEGCEALGFPVNFAFSPANFANDQPTEFTAEASEVHEPGKRDTSQVRSASFTLPEGMTLNPSAAHGLEACTPAQANEVEGTEKFTEAFGVACPAGSKIATVSLNVPTLPNGSLTGSVYLGAPASGTITGPPYTMYVVANSPQSQFNVSVRLVAHVIPNEATGRLETVFTSPPEQPFTSIVMHFERNVLAPVANPLVCGAAHGSATFVPTAQPHPDENDPFEFNVTGCAATLPFSLTQATANQTTTAGGHTSYTFSLARNDGNQYVSEVKTELPPGLVGEIPKVTLCGEPQAAAGTCSAQSQIGTAVVQAGAGSTPYTFNGPVYLTTSYNGAPYGMSIAVPAVAGPFNLGTVVTRASVNVNPTTGQVIADSVLPRIVKGIPVRLKNIAVSINKQGFLLNPTSCTTPMNTTSTLSGFTFTNGPVTGTQTLTSAFPALTNCSALKFKPTFKASTSSKTSRSNGAGLTTTITQASGESNIKSVKVQLPKQLPSRLSTLNKSCIASVFANNPYKCPSGAFVGGATVETPTLPGKLTGAAIFVSHAGASFPDLDLVVESASHVRVILTGNTNIKNGITTTTFASTPDVPIKSVTVNLPVGSHSALGSYGDLCEQPLVMPTTIVSQSGKTTKQNTIISVSGCGVRIVGHKTAGNIAYLTVKTFAAGRISGSGSNLSTVYRHLSNASNAASLQVPLSSAGANKGRPLKTKVRVGFVPKKGHATSVAFVTVTFG
ncbi:MAG: hypothetical protein ACLQBB_11140 [Solirubrobacteraceae bacterium]